jgi:phosphoglycolate phosphatase
MRKAVFFDLDGTLIDSKSDLAAAVNHTRRDLGLGEWPQDRIIAAVGRGARHLLDCTVLEELKGAETAPVFEEILAAFRARYIEHCRETVALYPGVRAALETLRDAGWLLGVNTNKPNYATSLILEYLDIKDFFGAAVVAAGDCPELKPAAATLEACSARMGRASLLPDDWMVGDSWADMRCAENAGINGAFCTFGFGRLEDSRCTVSIDSMSRLPELLLGSGGR